MAVEIGNTWNGDPGDSLRAFALGAFRDRTDSAAGDAHPHIPRPAEWKQRMSKKQFTLQLTSSDCVGPNIYKRLLRLFGWMRMS
jgi:hypothetical protein